MARDDFEDGSEEGNRQGLRVAAWLELERAERALLTSSGSAASGRSAFDSHGRSLGLTQMPLLGELLGRAQRLRTAMDLSLDRTQAQLKLRFAAIEIASIWPVLRSLLEDIALCVGGGAVGGAAVGGALGALAGGVGAVPGAMGGVALGTSAGLWVLNFIGLAMLAGNLKEILPRALEHYVNGCRIAWGAVADERAPQGWRGGRVSTGGREPGATLAAADEIAQGHVLLATALLLALMVWITRGKGNRAAVLQEIRESRRLGPRMAAWIEAQEGKFGQQMAMTSRQTSGRGAARPPAPQPERAPPPARAPREKPPSKQPAAARVVSRAEAERMLVQSGLSPDYAKAYVRSFDGPITAREVTEGERFLRYHDVVDSKGSFLQSRPSPRPVRRSTDCI